MSTLKPEDYLEPNCLLCDKPIGTKQKIQRIPQQRVSEKVDELMAKKQYRAVDECLKYWYEEAKVNGDEQGVFHVLNERMGVSRKTGRKEEGYKAIEEAMGMLEGLGYTDSVSGATCYTNAATVYTVFHDDEKAMELFQKAKDIYEKYRENNEYKLASLYNNMATSLTALKRYEEADENYIKALSVLEEVKQSGLEKAMSYLNRIDILLSQGIEEDPRIEEYLEKAWNYLNEEDLPRDSYYSYVADKCVGIYDYFGYFRYANELRKRIKEIDERA